MYINDVKVSKIQIIFHLFADDHQGLFHRKFFNNSDSDTSEGSDPPGLLGPYDYEQRSDSDGQHGQYQGQVEERQKIHYPQPRKLPTWFDTRPFQYNGRILLISLPGLTIILSLTGEM